MSHEDEDEARMFAAGLYALSEGLRMQANGSGDPWTPEVVAQVVAYLRKRLEGWRDRGTRSRRFDAAVRECVEAAVEEWAEMEAEAVRIREGRS